MNDGTVNIDGVESGEAPAIAELLAQLSQLELTPAEVDPVVAFEASEVPANGGGLIAYVVRIQEWMRLPAAIPHEASTRAQVEALAAALGVSSGVADTADGAELELPVETLAAIRSRLERATGLAQAFEAEVEQTGSVQAATKAWIEAWDEQDDSSIEGDIIARTEIWPIQDFSAKAKTDRLLLSPSYQRGDVWPTADAQLLIESILRGIPLPSVIILKPDQSGRRPFEVVDGKQRLTSILRFIGAHPEAVRMVKAADADMPDQRLWHLFTTDYPRFRRVWAQVMHVQVTPTYEQKMFFPFRLSRTAKLSGELVAARGLYYSEIRELTARVGGESVQVWELFESACDYKIPLITYTMASPRQIHQVFSLYNKQGKHLNAEEMRNAVYHEVPLMRALSVVAGDTDADSDAAPFLSPLSTEMKEASANLSEYRFGDARYRRTKVLSWLASMVFVDSMGPNGVMRRSTAKQIDEALLERVKSDARDPLASTTGVRDAMQFLSEVLELHGQLDAWAPDFKDGGRGTRWQELQLVASLLAVALVHAVDREGSLELLEEHADDLVLRTAASEDGSPWRRPTKTQTASQWNFIAGFALGVVELVGLDTADVDAALRNRFKYSCVRGLEDARRSLT